MVVLLNVYEYGYKMSILQMTVVSYATIPTVLDVSIYIGI